jgi:hypothetical protein
MLRKKERQAKIQKNHLSFTPLLMLIYFFVGFFQPHFVYDQI